MNFLNNLQRFNLSFVVSGISKESSSIIWRKGISSLSDLYDYVNKRFEQSIANKVEKYISPSTEKALYFMQWVSGMWGYGNIKNPYNPGRIINNEISSIDPKKLSISYFLNSKIADCQDFAATLAFMLSKAGIQSRVVVGNGHIFNEALVDNKWITLDATLNLYYKSDFANVLRKESKVDIVLYTNNGLSDGDQYRKSLFFYPKYLYYAANGVFINASVYSVEQLYKILPDGQFYAKAINKPPLYIIPNSYADSSLSTLGTAAAELLKISNYNRFTFKSIANINSFLSSQNGWRENIDNLQSFIGFIKEYQNNYIGSNSSKYDKIVFAMNWISGIWSYTNDYSIKTAYALSCYLKSIGLSSVFYHNTSTVLVQTSINSQTWTFDPTLNRVYAAPASKITDGISAVTIYQYTNDKTQVDSKNYSKELSSNLVSSILSLSHNQYPLTSSSIINWTNSSSFSNLNFQPIILADSFVAVGSWTDAYNGDTGWQIGDFNGDGKSDLVRYVSGKSGADVFLSTGNSFVAAGSWTDAYNGDTGWQKGDFNGDGKSDLIRYVSGKSGADVFLSTGNSFVAAGSWTDAYNGDTGWQIGDFNGDGKSDLIRYVSGKSGADVFLSTGNSFVAAGSWTDAYNGDTGWQIGDFNGDGKSDLIRYVSGKSGADVFLSTGNSFVAAGSWTDAYNGDTGWQIGDFNGNGSSDLTRYVMGKSGADVLISIL